MIQLGYCLRFHTPAFLGNAEQSGQWRTPPIKALLRQWWRVVCWQAADHPAGVSVDAMRQAEGQLFGVAADGEGKSSRSQVRLRLNRWDEGRLDSWNGQDQARVGHPEVKSPVGAQLYLGYGPLVPRQGTALKARAAIQADEQAELLIALPPGDEAHRLQQALSLMHLYGTLGGRSRNGWGSFSLTPLADSPPLTNTLDQRLTLPWRDALRQDWPQALGADAQGALTWQTDALPDWQAVMRRLAEVKIALRTQFRFPHERPDGRVHDRHWLSYPVTKHDVSAWKRDNLRLPNSLRFKVRAEPGGRLRGVVFHVPCKPPPAFGADMATLARVWQQVHTHLDADPSLKRIPA